ncbi:cold-shock protein [Halogranum rubrum]|uniref:cold-shock protein n=1 Tax=Halogranum rubrum TaxID=553466 RepID=UPI00067811A1|nr:cold shock domain-containing protein [Halogranum salarium]
MVKRSKNKSDIEAIGQVKFFKPSEGYGFIQVFEPDGVENDIFFHISDYKADAIYKDWWVKFDMKKTKKGLKGINLRRVSQPPESQLFGTSFNY